MQSSAEKAPPVEGEEMPLDEENENIESNPPENERQENENTPPAEESEEMESEPPRKVELKAVPPIAKKSAPAPAPKPVLKRTPEPAPKAAPSSVPRPILKHVAEEEGEVTEEPVEAPAEVSAEDGSEEVEIVDEAGTRWQCPKCGNNLRSMIREVTDKTVVLSTYPAVYGKKLVCGKCGKEWRQK